MLKIVYKQNILRTFFRVVDDNINHKQVVDFITGSASCYVRDMNFILDSILVVKISSMFFSKSILLER